jgi:hypothetical protein
VVVNLRLYFSLSVDRSNLRVKREQMIKKMLGDLTNEFARGVQDQYWQWMFSEPLIISAEENQQSLRPQKVVRKFIYGFVLDYDRWFRYR